MLNIGIQFFGGRGSGGGKRSGNALLGSSGVISETEALKIAQDKLVREMPSEAEYVEATEAKIVSSVTKEGMADVEVTYATQYNVPVGIDMETGNIEYSSETDYSKEIFRMKVKK